MRTALIALVTVYRYGISPIIGPCCRFHPSCSRYALTVLRRFGPWRGSWLAARRIARCHPWHPGGYDPAPPALAPRPAVAPPDDARPPARG